MGDIAVYGAVAVVLLLAIALFVPTLRAFARELKYVNMKIMNSRHNKELEYWERRKKKLWLSLLPFCHYNRHGHHHHDDH